MARTTAATRELNALWDSLSHKVLASVLVDHAAVFPVLDVLGTGLHWFPPKAAKVWAGVLQCVDDGIPPTVEAVKLRCGHTDGYVQAIAKQWNDDDNRKVVYHAGELKRLGALAELRKLGREMLAVIDPADVVPSIGYAESRLSGLMAVTSDRRGDAEAVSAGAWARVDKFKGQGILTGLGWYDKLTGGLWPGMNVWITAAYKKGKSSLMRNLVLRALEDGHAVDVYCAEGSREMFALDCQAMIATQTLCKYEKPRLAELRLSGLFILRVWREQQPILTKAELDAVHRAREVWERYNVRVWDTCDGIRDLATFRHRIQRSKFEHGSLIHWADYSQLFGAGATLYERQSNTALTVQNVSQSEDVMVGMLSQRNEAAIGGGGGYSAGVKGGGDASAAADIMLLPAIDNELPNTFRVTLKFSRHTGLGSGTHTINPSSGLIVDRWYSNVRPLAL